MLPNVSKESLFVITFIIDIMLVFRFERDFMPFEEKGMLK